MQAIDLSSNRRLFINTLVLFGKVTINLLISLYCSRVVLQTLGVVDFGIYNVVGGVVTFSALISSTLSSATQRFLSYELGKGRSTNKVFNMSMNSYLFIILIIVLLSQTIGLWFVTNKLNVPQERELAIYWVYQASVLSFVFGLLTAPYGAILLAYEKMKIFAIFGIVISLLRLILVINLPNIPGDKLILYAILVTILSFVSFLLEYLFVKYKINTIYYNFEWDYKLFKKLFNFTGWSLIGNLSAVMSIQGVNVTLNLFFGPVINAAQGIASQVNGALLTFVGNINTAVNPQIIKSYSSGEQEKMIELVFQCSKYSFLIFSVLAIPILINMEYIFKLWLGEYPEHSLEFTTLVIIDSLIGCFSTTLIMSIQATGKIKIYQIVVGFILLIKLPVSYILLLNFHDPKIPFLVGIILSIIALNVRLIFVKRYFNIPIINYYKHTIFRAIMFFVISIFIMVYIKINNLIYENNFILTSAISIFISLILIWVVALTRKERSYIISYCNKLLHSRAILRKG